MSEDTELACHAIQFRRQRDGDAALGAGEAAVVHRRGDAGRMRAAVRGADREGRSFASTIAARASGSPARAGNVRLAQSIAGDLPRRRAHRRSRLRARRARSGRRARARASSMEARRRARARALRARARGAQGRRSRRAPRGSSIARPLPEPDRLYGNARLAFHAARQHAPRRERLVPRGRRDAALRRAARVARARGAARAVRGATCSPRSTRCRAPQQDEAAWRYWRARALVGARRSRTKRARAFAALARRVQLLRAARRRGARQRASSPPSQPRRRRRRRRSPRSARAPTCAAR